MKTGSGEYTAESRTGATGANWRDEVASRVSGYKQRHNAAPAAARLDFGPETASRANRAALSQKPFDTKYYRRLNAAALDAMSVGVARVPEFMGSATAPALQMPEVQEASPAAASLPIVDDRLTDAHRTVPPELVESSVPQPEAAEEPLARETSPGRATEAWESEALQVVADPEEAVSNVIVFPHAAPAEEPSAAVPLADELAEPVFDHPRILDVPEEVMVPDQGDLFAALDFDDGEEIGVPAPSSKYENVNLYRPAPKGARCVAALVDSLLVLGATMAFAAIAGHALSDLPRTKAMLPLLAMVPVALWSIYQFLFLYYAGRTMGMEVLRLRVSTFDGETPGWRQRRRRALCTLFSAAMAGMGVLWALIDENGLCWHDRNTSTYIEQL
jgi:uncharacterized RDD family membrane protein YckC